MKYFPTTFWYYFQSRRNVMTLLLKKFSLLLKNINIPQKVSRLSMIDSDSSVSVLGHKLSLHHLSRPIKASSHDWNTASSSDSFLVLSLRKSVKTLRFYRTRVQGKWDCRQKGKNSVFCESLIFVCAHVFVLKYFDIILCLGGLFIVV